VIDIEAAVPMRSGFFCLTTSLIGVLDNIFGVFQLFLHASKAIHHIAVSFSAVGYDQGSAFANRNGLR
jgi:hypothetical protein